MLVLGIFPKETKEGSQRNICIPTFVAALFIISKTWKNPKDSSVDKWINKT